MLNCSVIRYKIHLISPAAEPLAQHSLHPPVPCPSSQTLPQEEQPWGQGSSSPLPSPPVLWDPLNPLPALTREEISLLLKRVFFFFFGTMNNNSVVSHFFNQTQTTLMRYCFVQLWPSQLCFWRFSPADFEVWQVMGEKKPRRPFWIEIFCLV